MQNNKIQTCNTAAEKHMAKYLEVIATKNKTYIGGLVV